MSGEDVEEELEDERRRRTVIGLVLAPFVGGPLGGYLFLAAASLLSGQTSSSLGLDFGFSILIPLVIQFSFLVGLPIAFGFGFPAHLVLKRRLNGWLSYAVAGVVIGVAGVTLALIVMGAGTDWLRDHKILGFPALAGMLGALTFWLIRRPDKDVRLNQSGSNSTSA